MDFATAQELCECVLSKLKKKVSVMNKSQVRRKAVHDDDFFFYYSLRLNFNGILCSIVNPKVTNSVEQSP